MALQNVYVGLFYDGAWQDITADARVSEQIEISRGGGGSGAPKPAGLWLRLGNRYQNDRYNPDNPMSPLYGKVGRNTPITVAYDVVDEDFEDTVYNIAWSTAGDANWARASDQAHTGTWSLKSGDISDGGETNLFVTVPTGANTLSFWYRIDSEAVFDQLGVFTAEGLQLFASGSVGWTLATIDVTGSTQVTFSYQKDSSVTVGGDAVWVDDLRFCDAQITAEVTKWAPQQTVDFNRSAGPASQGDAWTDVTAYGFLARLGQATEPLRSALYRATTMAATTPAGYWPLEDVDGSAVAVSGVGGAPMVPVTTVRYTLPDGTKLQPGGAPKFAQDGGVPGADSLVSLTDGGTLRAKLPTVAPGEYAVDFVFRHNPGAGDGTTSADIFAWYESGTYKSFTVNVTNTSVTVFHANAADRAAGSFTGSATASVAVFDGAPHHFRYTVDQSGGNYAAELFIDGTSRGTANNFVPPMAGTVGSPTTVELNPLEDRGDYMPAAIGHVTVWATATPPATAPAAFGTPGERAGVRLRRLGVEEGWPVYVRTDEDATMPMGAQGVATALALVDEIERTEDGLINDQRGGVGLVLRTRAGQYNQAARLVLSMADGSIAPILVPVFDNRGVANQVTAKNRTGEEATVVETSGPMSVQPPPGGVGRYPDTVDVNVDTDTVDLEQVAWWWLNKGTVEGARFPKVTVDLLAAPALARDASAVDPGDRITINGLKADPVDLRVLGIDQRIGSHTRTISYECEPYQQFVVGAYDDTTRRLDSGSTTLAGSGATTTSTALTLSTTNRGDCWSTTAGPGWYDLMIGGERMHVTAMTAPTGAGPYSQTATVQRSQNGVVKTHAVGAEVHVATPARYAL
jgi:hypothetical protein